MPRFLIEKEVSELMRCSLSKLRADRWQCRGVPYIKNGHSVLYDEKAVLDFLDSRRIKTTEVVK